VGRGAEEGQEEKCGIPGRDEHEVYGEWSCTCIPSTQKREVKSGTGSGISGFLAVFSKITVVTASSCSWVGGGEIIDKQRRLTT